MKKKEKEKGIGANWSMRGLNNENRVMTTRVVLTMNIDHGHNDPIRK